MKWLGGKSGGLAAFALIAGLVAGGLGWATAAALQLEREQLEARCDAEQAERQRRAEIAHADLVRAHEADFAHRLRLALWRLDGRVSPVLAREDSRPFNHYSSVFAPACVLRNDGSPWQTGSVLEPSPLLSSDLPSWMLLHFQATPGQGMQSPQVPSKVVLDKLTTPRTPAQLTNATKDRAKLLDTMCAFLPAEKLLAVACERAVEASHRDTAIVLANRLADNNKKDEQPEQQQVAGNPAPTQQGGRGGQDGGSQGGQLGQGPYQGSEYGSRAGVQSKVQAETRNPQRYARDVARLNLERNGENWMSPDVLKHLKSTEATITLSPMFPAWVGGDDRPEHLVLLRRVRIDDKDVCQGIVLDAGALRELLLAEVVDLFPQAKLVPVGEGAPSQPERTMTALPFQLDPGPIEPPPVSELPDEQPAVPGWTPLRVGLTFAWAAALVALFAVGVGGWSLIDLSERRIRFVSAVTHELRTPLTTLRLYLDMLMNGFVRDERQRQEYIHTLHAEADRLNRLIGNVLDFSRLEKQRPNLVQSREAVGDMLDQIGATWQGRCGDAGKQLVIENALPAGTFLTTDADLVQQVVGTLIDNACKYSRAAEDRRVWVRASARGDRILFEVEDRGPGVPAGERRSVFRAFRRGQTADVTAGGVGLGLALARRWATLLSGHLTLRPTGPDGGACFRLSLPITD